MVPSFRALAVTTAVFVIISALGIAGAPVGKLTFSDEGTFKIIQFTDMHFGEPNGEEKDAKTLEVLCLITLVIYLHV